VCCLTRKGFLLIFLVLIMQMNFACAITRACVERCFFCLNGQSFPNGNSCFFSVRWCLTKCVGSHSSCIDETTSLLNIPVFSSGRSGEVTACLAGQWEPEPCWQGGESQLWDAVTASPKIVWLKLVLRHIKKGAKDLS